MVPKPARRRGRPPRLQRADVLDAALQIADAEGLEALTMGRLAEAVGSSPMALYRHVGRREALLDSLVERVLSSLDIETPPGASWREGVEGWMRGLRAQLVRHPRIMALVGDRAHRNPAWLRTLSPLAAALRRAGLGGRDLAEALVLTSRMTMGVIAEECRAPLPHTDWVRAGREALSGETRREWLALLPHLATIDDDALFDRVVERSLSILEAQPTVV
jgi:TetR/AcrR family tetracycline transcriptional repressor